MFSRELISQDEMQQLDVAARDALRLQRELFTVAQSTDPVSHKFETELSKGDPSTV